MINIDPSMPHHSKKLMRMRLIVWWAAAQQVNCSIAEGTIQPLHLQRHAQRVWEGATVALDDTTSGGPNGNRSIIRVLPLSEVQKWHLKTPGVRVCPEVLSTSQTTCGFKNCLKPKFQLRDEGDSSRDCLPSTYKGIQGFMMVRAMYD